MSAGLEAVVDGIVKVALEAATEGRSRLAISAEHRVSCEGWLKTELLWRLTKRFLDDETATIRVEQQRVDLEVDCQEGRVLIELKTFPTNYGGVGKPITNFVQSVIDDLEKLSRLRTQHGIGLAVWLAYPIPDPQPSQWASHLSKIQSAAAETLSAEFVEILGKRFAHLYVMRSK